MKNDRIITAMALLGSGIFLSLGAKRWPQTVGTAATEMAAEIGSVAETETEMTLLPDTEKMMTEVTEVTETAELTELTELTEVTEIVEVTEVTEAAESLHTHSYQEQLLSASTCKEPGIFAYTCSCGDSYTETIPLSRVHKLHPELIKAPTATEAGIITYTCMTSHPRPSTGGSMVPPICLLRS